MFVRPVGKHQVGNLSLAALKGTFTQRLGADFELAARVARMVDSNASYKWQMGNEIFLFCFVFDLFFPDVKCSLLPDRSFVNGAAKAATFRSCGSR